MAEKKEWTRVNIGSNLFIAEGDIREVLEVIEPEDTVDMDGVLHSHAAGFRVAGPKDGSFILRLPKWYWEEIQCFAQPGMGIDAGGWLDGKFIRPRWYQR